METTKQKTCCCITFLCSWHLRSSYLSNQSIKWYIQLPNTSYVFLFHITDWMYIKYIHSKISTSLGRAYSEMILKTYIYISLTTFWSLTIAEECPTITDIADMCKWNAYVALNIMWTPPLKPIHLNFLGSNNIICVSSN